MPEIWVTHQELAGLFDCTETEARKLANNRRLDRANGRDGLVRVKLCPVGVALFAERLRAPNDTLDRAIEEQQARYAEMRASLMKRGPYYPWVN